MSSADDDTRAGPGDGPGRVQAREASTASAAGSPGGRDSRRERRWWRRALKAALVIALSIGLVLAGLLFAASTYFSDERVRDLIVGILDDSLLGGFEIDEVSLSLRSARIEARGLRVSDPEGEEVLFARHLDATIEPLALLRDEVRIRRLLVDGASVRLVPPPPSDDPEPSSFSLIDAFATTGAPADPHQPSGSEWSVNILDLTLAELTLHLSTGDGVKIDVGGGEVSGGRLAYDAGGIEVALGGDFQRIHVGIDDLILDLALVSADRIALTYPPGADGRIDLGTIRAAYGVTEQTASLGEGETNLQLTGSIVGLGEQMETEKLGLQIDLAGAVDVESAAIRGFLPDDLAGSLSPLGRVAIEAEARGTVGSPRATGSFSSTDLVVIGEAFSRVQGRFAWEAGVLDLDELSLILPDGRAEGRLRVDLTHDVDLIWRAALSTADLPIERLAAAWFSAGGDEAEKSEGLPLPERISGSIDTQGRLGESLVGRATIDILASGLPADLLAGLPETLRFRGTAHLEPDLLRLEPMRATGSGLDVDARGTVPMDEGGGALDLSLRVQHARPKDFFSAYELPLDARALELGARITGTLEAPRVEGKLGLAAAKIEGVPDMDLLVPFRFAGGTIALVEARGTLAGGEVVVSGSVDVLAPDWSVLTDPRFGLSVRAGGIRLDRFIGDQASGRLSFNGRIEGSLASPRGTGDVEIDGLEVLGVPFSKAQARVGTDGDWMVAEHFELLPLEGGRLEGSGRLRLSDMAMESTVTARDLPLSLAGGLTEEPLPLLGRADLDISVSGTIEEPAFTATLAAGELRYADTKLGSLEAAVDGNLTRMDLRVGLVHEAGRLDAAGWVSLEEETLAVSLSGQRLRIEDLPFVAELEQGISGRVLVDLAVSGSFSSPEILGRILARTLEFDGERFGDGRIDVEVRPAGVGVHALSVDLLGASRLDMEVRLDPVVSILAVGGLDRLSLAWLVPSLAEHELDAILTGRLRASWVMDKEMDARVDLDSLSVKVSTEVLESRRPMSLAWDGRRLVIQGLSLQGPNGTFEASGEIGETIDLVAKGNLEMELLAPFIADIALATGTVEIDLKAVGDSDAPRITGDIGISRALRIRPRRMIREVEIAAGRARFEPGKLVVERISGNVHGGIFRASGEVELEGLDPKSYRFVFSGQEIPLRTESLLLEANADIVFAGEDGRSKVSGRVEVVRGRYMEKFELDRFVFRRARRTVDEPLSQRVPMLNDIDLDLRLVSLGAMEISADAGAFSLDMVLDADLAVTGTAADPILDGRVEANRGGLKFPRARLDVARSNIEFVPRPGEAIRPRIDLRAEGEVTPASAGEMGQTTYFITLILDGDLEEMILDLTSDPSLDRLEILSLLVTGRKPADHLAGSAGTQADAAMVFAGSQLAEPLTRFVTQQLESYLNLELELSAEVTSAGLVLVAGKEVTRRLRFEWAFQRAFAGDQAASSAARARYLISDRIFFEGTTESVMGQGTASAGAREGARSRLELKLRIYGN